MIIEEYKGVKIYADGNLCYYETLKNGYPDYHITLQICRDLIDSDEEARKKAKKQRKINKWRKWYRATDRYKRAQEKKRIKEQLKNQGLKEIVETTKQLMKKYKIKDSDLKDYLYREYNLVEDVYGEY